MSLTHVFKRAHEALLATCMVLLLSQEGYAQDLSQLYEQVKPSVVVLFTEEMQLEQRGASITTVSAPGLGSGFMISPTTLMTAAHVVNVAEQIFVRFSDGDIIKAHVSSSFKGPDVALLRLERPKRNAVTATLGNSDAVKIGERVFVVGAPYGLAHSLSSGYVSGRIKEDRAQNPFTNTEYLQTDAAINSGNSGGPMFNLEGKVIGIVSHIKTLTGGFQGIGFAASSNIAKSLLLEKHIPWTGAEIIPLSEEAAKLLNVPRKGGLLVQRVVSTSPYGKMGVRGGKIKALLGEEEVILGGDIILSINNIPFEMTDEALKKIGDYVNSMTAEDPIILEILREGKIMVLRSDQ